MRAVFLWLLLTLLLFGCAGSIHAGPLCPCGPACACPDCDCLCVGVEAGMQGIEHLAKPGPFKLPEEVLKKLDDRVEKFFGKMEKVVYWDAFWRGAISSAVVFIGLVVLYLALTRAPDRKLPGS